MPRAIQNAKRLEFEKLKQGSNMSVADYEAEFTNLAEYAPHLLITEDMKARKFEEGLKFKIRKVIRPLQMPTYADVLDRAIIVEQDVNESKLYHENKKRALEVSEPNNSRKRNNEGRNNQNDRGNNWMNNQNNRGGDFP